MGKLSSWLQKHLVLSPQLLISFVPLVSFLGTLFVIQASPNHLIPQWSDEVYYWHQAATFDRVGFEGGYYTANEEIAPAGTPFFAWGIGAPMFYGAVASIFGWSFNSIPLVNLAIYTLGLVLFLALVRLGKISSLLLTVILLTYTPFIIYAPTSMIEIGQYGVAVIFSLVFVKLLQSQTTDKKISPVYILLILFFIAAVAFIRLTWLLFLLPIVLLWLRPKRIWQWVLVSAVLLASVLILAFSIHRYSSPYQNTLSVIMDALREDIANGVDVWLTAINDNLGQISTGNNFEMVQRLTILFIIVALCALLFSLYWRTRSQSKAKLDKAVMLEIAIHFYNLMAIFTFQILFYDVHDWRGFRLLAPHILVSILLLAAHRRWLIMGGITLIMLASLPMSYRGYRNWHNYARQESAVVEYQTWQNTLAPILQYDPDANSAWCNTLLHTLNYIYMPRLLMAFEPGLGISMIYSNHHAVLPQYLLLTDEYAAEHGDELSLQLLLEVPDGALYRNLSANC